MSTTPIPNVPLRTPMDSGSPNPPTLDRTWVYFFQALRGAGLTIPQLRIETPAGAMNGANVVFALSNTVASAWLALFLNGVYQEPTSDFTLGTDQMTITMTVPPKASDYALFALYLTLPAA